LNSNLELAIEKIEYAIKIKNKALKGWLVVADRYLKFYSKGIYERHWTAEDIVYELIERILAGERKWDSERVPDFNKFMYSNIRSIVAGKLKSRQIVETVDNYYPDVKESRVKKVLPRGLTADNPEIWRDIETYDKIEISYNKLLEDEDAALVLLYWKEGNTSKKIAESLGISVIEVERIKKRIRYHLKQKIN
jgi:RNA polymerase sigma factor (sigma-70 family)